LLVNFFNPASIHWTLRFEFITGASPKIQTTTAVMEGFTHNRGLGNVDVEPLDCVIPLKVYGALKTSNQKPKVQVFKIK
jgi:hypothetical protein